MVALAVLVIIFLVLLGAGLIIFAGFFIVNKVYLNKLIKLMDRYNKLSSSIHSINFFKIEILIKNELPIKVDLSKLKKLYDEVTDNLSKLYDNLCIITEEVNVMNLKTASRHIKETRQAIEQTEQDAAIIKSQYDQYTSYGDTIDDLVQTYEDIYETLADYFEKKVSYAKYFRPVRELLESISHTISQIPNLKLKFDFKKTVNSILDLRKKLITLGKALDSIVKFQVISEILQKNMHSADLLINKSFRTIETQDLQMVKKQQNTYKEYFVKFMKAYLALDLNNAQKYALAATDSAHQINNFVYIHTETQNLIDVSLGEIAKQTDSILADKEKIINSLNAVSRSFIKDPVITKLLKEVIGDIDVIEKLAVTSKAITSKTYSQKLDALKQIALNSKKIYDKKDSIKKTISIVNETLSNVIDIVTNLNDLYIYFCQVLALIKSVSPDDERTKYVEILIKNNLDLLNSYAKEIVENDHPDYYEISKNVINMQQNVDQLAKRLKTSSLLKIYATNLMVYSNRYRGSKENAPTFANATKLYKSKQYAKCIELLVSFLKNVKKQKKAK